MAITSVDLVLAGARPREKFIKAATGTLVAGRPISLFYLAGIPGAAVAPTPGIAGAALTTYSGQIPVPVASNNTHLGIFSGVSSVQAGALELHDRLWHNSGINVTLTTAQTVNSVTWPARDVNGTTDGKGVYIGLEISGATGAGVPLITISYTNSVGVAGRTATNVVPTVASSAAGTFYPIGLQAGDVGVRSIQSVTLSATWTSGIIHLVAYRPLVDLSLSAAGISDRIDAVTGLLPRVYDNSVPFLVFTPQTTSSTQLSGNIGFTQG